ncbi:MAG: hypothetical protein CVU27_06305 [Betaproteobacteria bacterium HGW-Betaproteobacteria-20]|jgi:Tfp pilus assembly protein PilX|nr:MAG: hypothetical protein CVU27_06305 [Betaproteobacteria bacterium HGW-Betaproteobacteria-20]
MKVASIKIYHERGVVLFVALIALVVMSLAAVALIRSVDTNTMIAGNLAFKQSAVVSSDRGVETALGWIEAKVIANLADLNSDSAANAYYATYLAPDLDNPAVLKADATWAAAAVATGPDIAAGTENLGNNIRYIIQRMCREAVSPENDKCLFGDTETGTGGKGVKDATEAGAIISAQQSPMYRVTVRVTGPKNTVSYTQTFVY